MALADLIAEQHDLLVERFLAAAKEDSAVVGLDRVELIDSMAFFLDDLIETLAAGSRLDRRESAAASHGVERLAIGFRIERVIREYIIVADLILSLADERGVTPTIAELRTLMVAVGDGAAIAASEYVRRREVDLARREAEHAGFLAHEVRNSLASARFAFDLLRRREFADPAPLVTIVDAGLRQASARIDDSLAGARARGGVVSPVRVYVALTLDEIAAQLRPQAQARQIEIITEAAHDLSLQTDARLLRSALENLASNGVKFSRQGGTVVMRAHARGESMLFEIADSCGGVDESSIEQLFRPFVQVGDERSGFGLGLAIARDCAEAQAGTLHIANVPGHGCVFTLSLPLQP